MENRNPDLRVMLDATVLIAGVVWPRWSDEVIQQGLQGNYRLVLCEYVIQQARKRIRYKFPAYLDLFEEFLQEARFELVESPGEEQIQQNIGLVRDITDVPVALAAILAGVDFLVSEDKDLTTRDQTTEALHKQVQVLIAGTFLREVMGWESEELEKVRARTWKDFEMSENE